MEVRVISREDEEEVRRFLNSVVTELVRLHFPELLTDPTPNIGDDPGET